MASKNAILIIEVARSLRAQGVDIAEAAVEASHERFRPILMTSFAFILGVVPLVIASGAGSASRQALGTAVFGGMIAATVFNGSFTPVFYAVFQGLSERLGRRRAKPTGAGAGGRRPREGRNALPGSRAAARTGGKEETGHGQEKGQEGKPRKTIRLSRQRAGRCGRRGGREDEPQGVRGEARASYRSSSATSRIG